MINTLINIPLKFKFWMVNGFSFFGMACVSLFAINREFELSGNDDFAGYLLETAIHYAPLVFILMLIVLGASQLLIHFVESHIYQLRDAMKKAETQGDMTVRVDSNSTDEIGQMSASFNAMQENLQNIIGTMTEVSHSGTQLSNELHDSLDQTTQAMDMQLQSARDTSERTEELRAATLTINEHTHEAEQATELASNNVEQGQKVLGQTTDAVQKLAADMESTSSQVNKLSEESANISAFLEVIRSISDQTNLLALNAAIEAARAGESGRGFAVVAEEVRNLAIKTHDATDKINDIVDRFIEGTGKAVSSLNHNQFQAAESATLVNDAMSAFTQIAAVVHQISLSSKEIAKETDHQRNLTEDVSDKIGRIRQLAEDTANNSQQAHGISTRLQAVSSQIDETAGLFKTSG